MLRPGILSFLREIIHSRTPEFLGKRLGFLLCSKNLGGWQSCSGEVGSRTGPGDESLGKLCKTGAAVSVPCSSSEQVVDGSCSEVVQAGTAKGSSGSTLPG